MTTSTAAHEGHIYYVFQSKLKSDIFKLGITSDLDRRWREHGGRAKQTLVYSGELGSGTAYQFERQIKRRFHHLRITDGNELFCLNEQQLAKVIELAQYHETTACQLRKAEAQRKHEAALQARVEAKVKQQAEEQRIAEAKAAQAKAEAEATAAQLKAEAEAKAAQVKAEEDFRTEELRRMAYHAERMPPGEALHIKRAMQMLEMRLPNNEEGARRFIEEVIRPEVAKESHIATLAAFLAAFDNDNASDGIKKTMALRCYGRTMDREKRENKRLAAAAVAVSLLFAVLGFAGLTASILSTPQPRQAVPVQSSIQR
jgi:hypothetical protein